MKRRVTCPGGGRLRIAFSVAALSRRGMLRTLPGDRGLEHIVGHAAQDQPLHRIGHADESIRPTPAAPSRWASAPPDSAYHMIRTAFERAFHPGLDVIVGHSKAGTMIATEPSVRTVLSASAGSGCGNSKDRARLRDGAHGTRAEKKSLNRDAPPGAKCRPVL